MANDFGVDILIQAEDPEQAARSYTTVLAFKVTDPNPGMVGLSGPHINLFIEPGAKLGLVRK